MRRAEPAKAITRVSFLISALPIISFLSKESLEFRRRRWFQGAEVLGGTPQEFAAYIKSEITLSTNDVLRGRLIKNVVFSNFSLEREQ